MAITTPVADPAVTTLPCRQAWLVPGAISPVGPASAADLVTGSDSPVSTAWLTMRCLARSSIRSAGTVSPVSSRTTSPGTSSSVGTSRSIGLRPSVGRLTTVAVPGSTERSAQACQDLRSWLARITQLITASPAIKAALAALAVTAVIAAIAISSSTNGLAAARTSSANRCGTGAVAMTFSPCWCSRACASASVRPRGPVPSRLSSASGAASTVAWPPACCSAVACAALLAGLSGRPASGSAQVTLPLRLLARLGELLDGEPEQGDKLRISDQVHHAPALAA